ncbi:MAG TPA: hypothetical protein VLM75_12635 [Spirochaetota bacterium]|nr:hypothetical protein [Spirochaetota bacterium]
MSFLLCAENKKAAGSLAIPTAFLPVKKPRVVAHPRPAFSDYAITVPEDNPLVVHHQHCLAMFVLVFIALVCVPVLIDCGIMGDVSCGCQGFFRIFFGAIASKQASCKHPGKHARCGLIVQAEIMVLTLDKNIPPLSSCKIVVIDNKSMKSCTR